MRAVRRVVAGACLAAATVVAVPGGATYATWSDGSTSTTTLGTTQLVAPVLACTDNGASVTISWTASQHPTLLTYVLTVDGRTGNLLPQVAGLARSVTLTSGLLSTLLGQRVTVRVTGTLPGTSWTVDSTIQVDVLLLGLGLDCVP